MIQASQPGIVRFDSPQLRRVSLQGADCTWHFVSATSIKGESLAEMFMRVAGTLGELDAQMMSQEVFGLPGSEKIALERAWGILPWPVTWLEPGPEGGFPPATQLVAVTGPRVHPIEIDDRPVGTFFDNEDGRWVRLGGLAARSAASSPDEQTREVFSTMMAALQATGMDFSAVLRTWFYNRDILSWYSEFNGVRTSFFNKYKVFDGLVPASTGIGGPNSEGTALVAGLLALGRRQGATVSALPSPLQCPALEYGSSFSRAVEVATPSWHSVLVSGTASIAAGGETAHVGDMRGQVALTMQVVEAILESRGMGWADVSRGIAYIRHAEDRPEWERYLSKHGLENLPVIVTENVICRDDLLFELEVETLASR